MGNVRDVMSRDLFTLPASLSLREAAWALMHRGLSGAPVRDADGNLVGVLSNADLVNPERGGDGGEPDSIEDVMTPSLLAVDEDDNAVDAARLMVEHGVRRVLVLSAAGELVGIVTPMDLLQYVLAVGRLEPVVESERGHRRHEASITHH